MESSTNGLLLITKMDILRIVCILICVGRSWEQEQTYIISAAKVFHVGASEDVVIQAYGYTEAFDATISIKSFPDKKFTYSSAKVNVSPENKFQNSASLIIQPRDLSKKGNPVSHVYLEVVSPHFTREKKIPLNYENGFLFIQTDKPVYTPDQSVKIRVYSLNEELKPARRKTTLTFIDPEGVEVEILHENDYVGIVSFPDFKIPSNPKYGVWTIKAKYKEDFTTSSLTHFEIKEYVMPRFSISIEPENNFISYKEFGDFSITIKASYFYNKKVSEGDVYVYFGIKESLEEDGKEMMHKAMQQTQIINGIAEVTFNSKKAIEELSYQSLEDLNNKYLYVAVTVLESTGGFYEEAEVPGIKYVLSPYQLNLIATPLFLKPGIPFPIKVQVKDPLDQFVGGVVITLNAKAIDENQEETQKEPQRSTTHQNNGVALFVVNLPSHVTTLEFNVRTEDPNLAEENQAFKEYRAVAYSSLSKSYLYIDWTENFKPLLVGDHLSITVKPKSPYIDKIAFYSYLVLSKGKIVNFGTRERLEHLTYQSLNIPITQDMVPSARLLVYYLVTGENRAELVADSVWLDVEEKCGNDLQVQLSRSENVFSPGQVLSLNLVTQENSWVALSAMDMAIYGVKGKLQKPQDMKRVMRVFEKSDQGCGAGGGQDSADVFHLAGLTFLTNANTKDSQENDKPCKEILRPKRNLKEEIDKQASKYKNLRVRSCCYDGAHQSHETCEQRLARVKEGKYCIEAFKNCCLLASQIRSEDNIKILLLGRIYFKALMGIGKPEIRSYFPESWLWEVYNVRLRYRFPLTLPDSITTWEIRAIGISDKGICVAEPLQVKVLKDVFLEMHIPYSVVRGEQIQVKGTAYNYRSSEMKFCAQMSVGEGICLAGSSSSHQQGMKHTQCVQKNIEGSSIQSVMFNILPLELGLHTINFTLNTPYGKEILVKTLRVVPEGIKRESHAGFTLDPQAVYGSISIRKEFQYRIPLDMVPKTKIERTVSVKGTLIGEVISAVLTPEGISTLSHLPKGSAEAELMSIIPVFYVYHYLESGDNWNILGASHIIEKENMKKKMKEGIISILSYRNVDYSYSMWKGRDASTWFTALALRIFGQVNKYIPQDKNSICNSLLWLIEKCQLENGSFKDDSDYQPLKLQGTIPKNTKEKATYLTAFTLIGMRKSFEICPTEKINEGIIKAESYLLENAADIQSTFTLAISSYALALGVPFHHDFRAIFSKLKKEAFVKGNPPTYRFWKNDFKNKDNAIPSVSTAQMVETTAYALLCSILLNEIDYANPIIKWLSEEQRYGGGFYSTQDTINAIEALTEYALLLKKLQLNMDIKISYKHKGDFLHYKMTDQNFLGRPVEVPLNDDLVVSTGFSRGLATVHVKTVVYNIGTSKEICNFGLKIDFQDMEVDSYGRSNESGDKLIIACASYKPNGEESSSGSSHAVMDIALPTGIGANREDLSTLTNGVDRLLTSYQIKDGHVILQLNSIPSDEFLCVRFRIFELFWVGLRSPATFSVYEYHRPDKQCTTFYSLFPSKLEKVCEGSTCGCVEADCGQMKKKLDLTISADARKEAACQEDIAYAYKVKISSVTQENSFVKYTATLLDIYKTGKALAQKNAEVIFIKKSTCASIDIAKGSQYLIMGKEALQIKYNFSFIYVYPLDSLTWIEYWPSDETCSSCKDFIANLEEFSEGIFLYGC
ncbi:complement C5-like [Vombatus ursinus]|uniref:Complement C5 n=1 Tax=Vombatus ursinus TaxID=29139 RepID=A0A4X2LC29_VOMUR|nr:complement C5-like [Vombatus ursinus]XP_027723947.1 complement C5-like [Vombatus ursinus]